MPRLAHAADPLRRRLRPRIDDRTHLGTRVGEVDRCGVGAVVGREHDGRAPGQHAVAVQEGAGPAGEHDAGTVVVGEHDRALVRPGRHEHTAGADAPDPLPRQVARCGSAEVVGAPLQCQDEAVVEVPERGGPLQVHHEGVARQLGGGPLDPVQRRRAVDAVVGAQERAARLGLLVDQDDARARPGGRQRGREAGRPRTHHEQVGVHVAGVVAGGVRHVGEPALAGDAVCREPVGQLDGGGQQHRLGERLLDLDQAVRVLRPGCRDPAGPAQLDAGARLVHAVGEQRRRQGVAGVAGQRPSTEGEPEGGAAVDPTPGGQPVRRRAVLLDLAHESAGFCSSGR